MRKTKIMLTIIAILATAGGVLAFKAAKRNQVICYTSAINGMCTPVRECGNWRMGKTSTVGIVRCTTTAQSHADCLDRLCPVLAKVTNQP